MKITLQFLALLLPWALRKRVLSLLGFSLIGNARIGFSILGAKRVVLNEGASIGHLNYFRGLDLVDLATSASIGNMNWITGEMSVFSRSQSVATHSASLALGEGAAISNRHYIDCNASITLGRFSTFAGVRSQLFTHSIDLNKNIQRVAPVEIGEYSFVGSGCLVLPGAVLPSRSVLSAGSVLRRGLLKSSSSGVYTGNPAMLERDIPENAMYFKRIKPAVEVGL